MPRWIGAALVVGDNPDAAALAELLATAGVVVRRLAVDDNLNATLDAFEEMWKEQPFPHVFLMMGRHEAPLDPANAADWERRRYHAATVPFYLCQRWVQLAAEAGLLDRSTLVAATSLGGDLGFSGNVSTPESGALTGLMKAVYIEFAVLRDYKTLLVKAIDAPESEPSALLAASICRELASRTVDYEVAYMGGQRYLQNAYLQPAEPRQFADIRPGSVWVVTGGARGITALCAKELGSRFGLKLHLVGSSPLPEIKLEWRELTDDGLKALQSSVMREARARGQSMDDAWARVRKDLEIDKSLRSFVEANIDVTYHECDVANAKVLASVLDTIRQTSGPIEGVLHGAGIERSCTYERKKPEIVEATLSSKVDGAIHLMQLTRQDPIRHFIGFGSVSGRLGSNGQADYCMASDLLCKLAVWYRTWRPEVRSVGIHWHPWADVGMAATPETAKLLKLSGGPASMNKDEGVLHLLREICADSCDTEVMITDDEYHSRYYCVDRPPLPVANDVPAAVPAALPELPAWQPMASRHQLVMVDAPLAPVAGDKLAITGAVCILGQNRDAISLRDRLSAAGVAVEMLSDQGTPEEAMAAIEKAYTASRFGYLFVMSAREESDGSLFDPQVWQRRCTKCVTVPFLAMQHWFRLRRQAKDSSPITIVAVTALGGDFGLSGNTDAPEGGALCGLLKSLYVEDTRKPVRELRVKVIDAPRDASPTSIVNTLLGELASDDPNVEVGTSGGRRCVVRSVVQPAESLPRQGVNHGGTWVVSGGARGITAAAALEMGKRFGLKLHLLGRSPVPQADAAWRNFTDEQLAELKAQTVRQAIATGRSPERDWDRVKHDREIHASLLKFAEAGVQVTYHSCDVADRTRLAEVLDEVRRTDGRIDGIVHGAGWARPGRFDSRSRDGMETTIAGKLDGAINLMSLTQSDPIRYWIGFGSISGRYGGNGLSDYAAANEMLAKLVDWYRGVRPDCASCCIHWQSWDEIGMAMLADNSNVGTKGVLKMDFISPGEGCEHLCRELEVGLPTSEVIITDGVFERIFHPYVQAATGTGVDSRQFPLVTSTAPLQDSPGINVQITFDPQADPFLIHHTLRGKPMLPAVVGLEALAEAATLAGKEQVVALTNVEFREGLKFRTEQPIETRVRTVPENNGTFRCELLSDFTNRAGVVMQKDRVHFVGHAETADVRADLKIAMPTLPQSWHPFTFRNDGPMVHGPVFQGVKGIAFDGHSGWGELDALSLSELGGAQRGTEWLVPATLLDAAFYVCGIHLWLNIEPVAALPRSIARLQLGRMPKSSERAYVYIQCRAESSRHAEYDFTIFGEDRAVIAHVEGYQCVMLKASSEVASNA